MQIFIILNYLNMLKWFYFAILLCMHIVIYISFYFKFIHLFTFIFSTFLNLIVKNSCFWHRAYVIFLFFSFV